VRHWRGHVLRCDTCEQVAIAYNSCRNRHCPKCQASAAKHWLEARQVDLLPVDYYHLVFTLPAPISAIAYYNKAVLYDLLFAVAAETLRTIAADPKHLGAQIGVTLVLHAWGSALTHHPHVHGIVVGGGLSSDSKRWVACRPGFFLPVRVLSRLFRRRFLEALDQAHRAVSCSSSVSTPRSPTPGLSPPGSRRCECANGLFTPSARLPGQRRCSPICPATRTGWRSRTSGCWRSNGLRPSRDGLRASKSRLYDNWNLASRSARASRPSQLRLPSGERLAHGQRRWAAVSWPGTRGYAFRIAAAPATGCMPYARRGATSRREVKYEPLRH
jgi:hypothetical protein